MSQTYYYHITNASPAVDFTLNGVDYGSFNFLSVFTTDDGSSGSIDGIPKATWNNQYAANAGPSPGTFTLTSNFTNGNSMMYGGGTQANGIDGGVLEINSGSFSGNQTVLDGSLILDTSVQAASRFTLIDAYLDFEGGTGGVSITFNQDSTVKLSASPISGNNTNFNGLTMTNFADGDGIAAPTGYHYDTSTAPVYTPGSPGTLTFTLINDSTNAAVSVTLNMSTAAGTTPDFSYTTDSKGDSVLALGDYVVCYYPGTLIRTVAGDRAVETLSMNDMVVTADGQVMPVLWVGQNTVSTRFGDPLRFLPIRIKAGALAEGVPSRDLLVSPDHALFIGGVLVQAGALVNDISITRETSIPEIFTYYHVELATHALLLAEDTPAESFVDNVDRMNFLNWDKRQASPPIIQEMEYPRAKSARQVPLAVCRQIETRASQFEVVQAA